MTSLRQVNLLSKNPVRRVRENAHLTLDKASREAGVHLQAFFLQEQGAYFDILPSILRWMQDKEPGEMPKQVDYWAYQDEKRRLFGLEHGLLLYELGPPLEANPFELLRKDLGLSRQGFAKRFCVHPGLLYRVETGISRSLPDQLRAALAVAGMSDTVLGELDFRIGEYSAGT